MSVQTCPIPTNDAELISKTTWEPDSHATIADQSLSSRVWESGQHCLELDGVRGIAIVGVTLYRLSKELDATASPGLAFARGCLSLGGRGVDLFFVLSGFLITGILISTKAKRGFFRNFIARRALRIFPLYFATLLVCLFVLPSLLSTKIFDLPSSNQFYLWTYTSNFFMARENSWCFGPLDHFWSLAVEEHFYLLWPIAVYFLSLRALLRLSVAIAIGVGVIRSLASFRPEWNVAVDVLTVFRCDALCMGAILAVIMAQRVHVDRMAWFAKRCLPLLFIATLVFAVTGKRWMTLPHTVVPALMAVILALIVTGKKSDYLSQPLRNPFLCWFGKYSYGMYVVQLPLLTLLPLSTFAPAGGLETMNSVTTSVVYLVAMIALICAIAYVSFHQFENRFLNLKRYFCS